MIVGIIDLGSNTFHLVIYQKSKLNLELIFRCRKYVYLSEGGKGKITDSAMIRGLAALREFAKALQQYEVNEILCVGTAMLRTASNASEFCTLVKSKLDWDVEIISGEKEAELIYSGITLDKFPKDNNLIMDIGGGSVEFISESKGDFVKSFSYEIGISYLRKYFSFSDPITKKEIIELEKYLDQQLTKLNLHLTELKPINLIGAAGPFEILESAYPMLGKKFSVAEFDFICSEILSTDLKSRLELPYMPKQRADLSKEAMLLVSYILNKYPSIVQVYSSDMTLKEGLARQYLG